MLFLPLLLLIAAPAEAAPPVTDAQIAAYAHAEFDKRAYMGRREVLGSQGGSLVIADHPCSDICPVYTRRIVHLQTSVRCEEAGGVMRERLTPHGVAAMPQPYCVPRVLADDPR